MPHANELHTIPATHRYNTNEYGAAPVEDTASHKSETHIDVTDASEAAVDVHVEQRLGSAAIGGAIEVTPAPGPNGELELHDITTGEDLLDQEVVA